MMNSRHSLRSTPTGAKNLAGLYGRPLLDWDGSPHVTGVGALWVDDTFWFETGELTRKGRSLTRDPRCSLSLATHEFDLVVEGTAGQVTDPGTVASMARKWSDQGWPA